MSMNDNEKKAMKGFFERFAPELDFESFHKQAEQSAVQREQRLAGMFARMAAMPQEEKDQLGNYLTARINAKGRKRQVKK